MHNRATKRRRPVDVERSSGFQQINRPLLWPSLNPLRCTNNLRWRTAPVLLRPPRWRSNETKIVPWIGVGLIFLSLLMPYVSIFGMGVSGGELIGFIGDALEAAGELDGDASGDDGGGPGLGFGGIMFFIAAAMLVFSPLVYLLSAIVACVRSPQRRAPSKFSPFSICLFWPVHRGSGPRNA